MADRNNILIDNNNRIFYLCDTIDNNTVSQINFQLIKLLMEDDKQEKEKKEYKREPIHIFINSNGGHIDDAWSLIDLLLTSKTPIYTYCTGYALSAGLFIFLAGEKRFATKHALFLYHQICFSTNQKYQDSVEYRQQIDLDQNAIEKFVQDRTDITEEKLQEIRFRKKDWYIHLKEALELNIATNIYKGEIENEALA